MEMKKAAKKKNHSRRKEKHMNWIFKVLLLLIALMAVVCMALIDINARAAPDAATTQREKAQEISILSNFAREIATDICITEFQRCSVLLTYTQVTHEHYDSLDAEIYMIAGCTPHGLTTNYGPCWARSGRGADISSRLLPALA